MNYCSNLPYLSNYQKYTNPVIDSSYEKTRYNNSNKEIKPKIIPSIKREMHRNNYYNDDDDDGKYHHRTIGSSHEKNYSLMKYNNNDFKETIPENYPPIKREIYENSTYSTINPNLLIKKAKYNSDDSKEIITENPPSIIRTIYKNEDSGIHNSKLSTGTIVDFTLSKKCSTDTKNNYDFPKQLYNSPSSSSSPPPPPPPSSLIYVIDDLPFEENVSNVVEKYTKNNESVIVEYLNTSKIYDMKETVNKFIEIQKHYETFKGYFKIIVVLPCTNDYYYHNKDLISNPIACRAFLSIVKNYIPNTDDILAIYHTTNENVGHITKPNANLQKEFDIKMQEIKVNEVNDKTINFIHGFIEGFFCGIL